jgi:hypothetical protein
MERIEADPIYRQCLSSAEEDPEGALQTYIEHYAIRESVFRDMPSTNGPGRYLNVRIESTSGIQRNQDAASS